MDLNLWKIIENDENWCKWSFEKQLKKHEKLWKSEEIFEKWWKIYENWCKMIEINKKICKVLKTVENETNKWKLEMLKSGWIERN